MSLVLSTLSKCKSSGVTLTVPKCPFTDCTGGAGVNSSVQLVLTLAGCLAKTKFLLESILTTILPTNLSVGKPIPLVKLSISAWLLTTSTDEKEIGGIWSEGITPTAFKLATPFFTPILFASNFKLILLDKLAVSDFCNR